MTLFESASGSENTGKFPGAEIAQLYVAPAKPPVERPLKELKGFQKVYLKPGESI